MRGSETGRERIGGANQNPVTLCTRITLPRTAEKKRGKREEQKKLGEDGEGVTTPGLSIIG